jgi:uncharacterized surface protein with fasciclin (FAS1) repeats
MTRYHTADEIRRFDLMKLGVLLLLILLLALAWIATRDQQDSLATGEQAEGTPTIEGVEGEEVVMPAPTLGIPSVNVPAEPPQPGLVTLSGTAGAGAQVVILVNGIPSGVAVTGVDGNWSTTVELAAGDYAIQAQTVDNVGSAVGESQTVSITVGGAGQPVGPLTLNPPGFDALTGSYVFAGTVAPGETIAITANGAVVGTAVADETGNFAIPVAADAISGDVELQTTDAAGNITQQSEPLKLNARPPTLGATADMGVDVESGAVILPTRPEGLTLSGQGEPGTQVELLVDGARGGVAVVDSAGAWSLPIALADGVYTMQLNTLDPGGSLLAGATPLTVVVGAAAIPTEVTATPGADTSALTIADLLAGRPEFSSLLSVLQTSGSISVLSEPGPFTTFAPTNEAFALLPQRVIDGLLANPQILSEVLQYHITRGRYLAADLQTVQPATVNGRLLTIGTLDGALTVNDAVITAPDTIAANGIVHAIDRILVPPLAAGVRPPVIDASGVPTFTGAFLTIVGTAEPNRAILVELNGEPFGEAAAVGPEGTWNVSGNVTPGDYQIVAYMLGAGDVLEAISRPVALQVRSE